MVQDDRDLWAWCSKMLASLQASFVSAIILNGLKSSRLRKTFHLTKVHQKSVDDMKATIPKDVSLAYPDYSEGIESYADGSKRQIGAVIVQNMVYCFLWLKILCLSTKIQHY